MHNVLHQFIVAIVATLVFATTAYASPLEVPAAVKSGVEKAYPESSPTDWVEVDFEGSKSYECKVTTKDSKNLKLQVSLGGMIFEIEENLAFEALPEVIKKGLNTMFPEGDPKRQWATTRVSRDGKAVKTYSVMLLDGRRKKKVQFQEDGTLIDKKK